MQCVHYERIFFKFFHFVRSISIQYIILLNIVKIIASNILHQKVLLKKKGQKHNNNNNYVLYCNNNINNRKKIDIKYHRIYIAAPPKSKASAAGASSRALRIQKKKIKKTICYLNTSLHNSLIIILLSLKIPYV